MTSALFDKSQEYDALLNRGLRLTGESKKYFALARVRDLRSQLDPTFEPKRILDFGCGIGDTARVLADVFSSAEVVGVDSAAGAIRHARELHGSARLRFLELADFEPRAEFDLCYCSGVFHHIAKGERPRAIQLVWEALANHGLFALFENNPWNPGTRAIMKRIPFDAGAIPIAPTEARALLPAPRWRQIARPRFLFYFPRWLAPLRPLESRLVHIPLGGQYYLLAVKQADH